ncbi:MAG TPA: ribonuclease J [Patescibacteria group bacterium]|nr:ribonuclease J [Patescibacteria group bacterium]
MTTKKTTHQTSGKTNQRKSFGRINRPASGQRSNVAPAGKPTRIEPLRVQATAGKQNINQPKKTGQRFYHPQKKKKETISQQKFTLQTVGGSSSKTLKIIPLGGCEEVGRNMTIFEYDQDIVILDMGMQFPEEDMPGIDYIIPNISYLKGKEKNIRGVIFSHGHLDHIGAAPILLERLGNPTIIGRDLTVAMVKHRQEDYKKDSATKLKTIIIKNLKNKIRLGSFEASFFQIEHSIMDAVGLILKTPAGTVIHPGDWTMERDKNGKSSLDYSFLSRLPKPTVLMLESLGAVDVRKSATSEEMKKNLEDLITKAPGRVVIGTFSSQTERINWIINTAQKLGKKVAIDGYSMKMNVEIAKKFGYIKYREETMIKPEKIHDYPDDKIVFLCTGAQGEGNAVLSRIIENQHRNIKLKKTDTVILSSSIIPGNERSIQTLKDNLYRQCDNVIHGSIMDIHVSGHANREDILQMLTTIKPTYFVPVYAYHYMLREAAKLAQIVGLKEKDIFVPDNGQIIELDKTGARLTDKKVPAGYVFVDGLGITDSNNVVLRDRQMMAEDGMLVVIATVDGKTGRLIHNPDLISRGFVYMKENKKLIEMTRQRVKKMLKDNNPKTAPDEHYLRDLIRNEIGKFLYQKTEKRPMILPVIIEV